MPIDADASRRSGVITLTTDFGTRDHYVGAMKGVIATLAPRVSVFDITHGIPEFDVSEGAFAIAQAYRFYPLGTVHVVVVDPGVGSSRRPIAVAAEGHLFIAPDNGVLSQVLESAESFEARTIASRHGHRSLSHTFHGRDLFAPAGARLATGLPFDDVGDRVSNPFRLPSVAVAQGAGRVLHVDGFGNVVTSFQEGDLPERTGLKVGSVTVQLRSTSYATVPEGRLFLIPGSSGYVEVSLNRGSAADALGVRAGAPVTLSDLAGATVCDQSAKENS